MTPAARIAAAIDVLDAIVAGAPTEQALTRWARGSRYAGSKDRAAVRDHVFEAVRHWRSDAVRGGGTGGRARMLGRLRAEGIDLETVFSGAGYGPAPLSPEERALGAVPEAKGDMWDLPDWLIPLFEASLDQNAEATAKALTTRAPVSLRVNTARTDGAAVQATLLKDGIHTEQNARASTALSVTQGARRVRTSAAYTTGFVELQDASSQAAVLGVPGCGTALDYCAGGGGKALALAALNWQVTAHDVDPNRMVDLPARAERADHKVTLCTADDLKNADPFELVFCDAPCSGSGTWRRTPEAKWALTPERLDQLVDMQASILEAAKGHVAVDGALVYATCSVLNVENSVQIEGFIARNPGWAVTHMQSWPVDLDGDGFFVAHLTRAENTD